MEGLTSIRKVTVHIFDSHIECSQAYYCSNEFEC